MILMAEQIAYIAKVTEMINQLGDPPDGYYLRVLLTDADDHKTMGAWCDEFGSDAWYFDTDPKKGEQ